MKFVTLFATLFVVSCLASDKLELQNKWEEFKSEHGKTYKNQVEERMRHRLWFENLNMVEEHNKLYEAGKVTYYLAQNHFSDMTENELKRLRNFKPSKKTTADNIYTSSGKSIPTSVDWRSKGAVNPVKDQGNCASSWAFSAIASIETQFYLLTGTLESFSEQQIIDCMEGSNCEHVNVIEEAYNYLETQGLEYDSSYPYTGKDGVCKVNGSQAEILGVRDYVVLPKGDENALTDAVAKIGVISIGINASRDDFTFYSGGVYAPDSCNPESLTHAVAAVGYGTDAKDGDYYLVRNSWGPLWGMKGYIMMARNKGNLCGIASNPSYPVGVYPAFDF